MTTACSAVRRIEIRRIQDASIRRVPFQQKIGATLSIAEFERRAAAGTVRHVGLRESVGMVADALGLGFDRIDETIAPVCPAGKEVKQRPDMIEPKAQMNQRAVSAPPTVEPKAQPAPTKKDDEVEIDMGN